MVNFYDRNIWYCWIENASTARHRQHASLVCTYIAYPRPAKAPFPQLDLPLSSRVTRLLFTTVPVCLNREAPESKRRPKRLFVRREDIMAAIFSGGTGWGRKFESILKQDVPERASYFHNRTQTALRKHRYRKRHRRMAYS